MTIVGQKIRYLREKAGISRPEFCGDEEQLTVRQLVRIEQGQSAPSLETLSYIAERLGMQSYQLMSDYQELSPRYQELKYSLLRQPDYGDKALIEQQERDLDEILDDFYDDLPTDEQFAIDCLQAMVQTRLTGDINYALPLFEEHIKTIAEKDYLSINDLPFLRMVSNLLQNALFKKHVVNDNYYRFFESCFDKLLLHQELFRRDELFILRNTIFAYLSYYDVVSDYRRFSDGIAVLNDIFVKTQDFQKKPLIYMLEWKVALFESSDFAAAMVKYQEAKSFAHMMGVAGLIVGLDKEWQQDTKKFYTENFFVSRILLGSSDIYVTALKAKMEELSILVFFYADLSQNRSL